MDIKITIELDSVQWIGDEENDFLGPRHSG